MISLWYLGWPLLAASLLQQWPSSDDDFAYRVELVNAIEDVADDEDGGHEARLLLSLSWHESRWVRKVGECTDAKALDTGAGALGAWQIVPRRNGGDEKRRACIVAFAALLARDRVRETRAACAAWPAEESLAVYTGGKCEGDAARRSSRVRWVD